MATGVHGTLGAAAQDSAGLETRIGQGHATVRHLLWVDYSAQGIALIAAPATRAPAQVLFCSLI